MTTAAPVAGAAPAPKKWVLWTGRVLSALPLLLLAFSASMKFGHSTQVEEMFSGHLGYPTSSLTGLGVLEILCAVIYAIPQTAIFGAILLTGYLGGATATHFRVGDSFLMPIVLGVVLWAGVYLRDERLRALLPLRKV